MRGFGMVACAALLLPGAAESSEVFRAQSAQVSAVVDHRQLLGESDARALKASLEAKIREVRSCVKDDAVRLRGVFQNPNLLWPLEHPFLPNVVELCGQFTVSVEAAQDVAWNAAGAMRSPCTDAVAEAEKLGYRLCGHARALSEQLVGTARRLGESAKAAVPPAPAAAEAPVSAADLDGEDTVRADKAARQLLWDDKTAEIVKRLRDPDWKVRDRMLYALMRNMKASAVPLAADVAGLLGDPNERVRQKAVIFFHFAKDDGKQKEVAALLADPDAFVRTSSLVYLGWARSKRFRGAVEGRLKDPDERVRKAARKALDEIGP